MFVSRRNERLATNPPKTNPPGRQAGRLDGRRSRINAFASTSTPHTVAPGHESSFHPAPRARHQNPEPYLIVRVVTFEPFAVVVTIEVLTASTDSENIANGDSGATYTTDGSASQTVTEAASEQGYAYGAYEYQAWGDTWGGNEDHTFAHTLSTTFTVTPSNGSIVYDIAFETQRQGTLGKADDTFSFSTVYSSAHIGELTGTINNANSSVLTLEQVDYTGGVGTIAVDQTSNAASHTGLTGTTTWIVETTWTSRVTSNYDESGVSMGQAVSEGFLDLDIAANTNDSVRTNAILTITAVPEPSTALLVALGFAGLAGVSRRRKRS